MRKFKPHKYHVPKLLAAWDKKLQEDPEIAKTSGVDPFVVAMMREGGDFCYDINMLSMPNNKDTHCLFLKFKRRARDVNHRDFLAKCGVMGLHSPIKIAEICGITNLAIDD